MKDYSNAPRCEVCGTAKEADKVHRGTYGDICEYCENFFKENPTPPVPPPSGTILINLEKKPQKEGK